MNILNNKFLLPAGVAIGAAAGYLYYHFVGCDSGSCGITSDPLNSSVYGAVMGGLTFSLFKKKNQEKQLNREEMKTIIDVRTRGEFASGNVPGSINIPLQELKERMEDIKKMEAPIVLCCASGGRSGQAASVLKSAGIECSNGGSWKNLL